MNGELSILSLLVEASLLVQLVMLILLAASIASWALIFKKRRVLSEAQDSTDRFEKRFWSGGDLTTLYRQLAAREEGNRAMENIFVAGFREFARSRQRQGVDPEQVVESARRAMHVAQRREVDALEESLAFLATVGSTSPYVGLFGTVWGIMNSFRALGNVQQATLGMVAPGIAEALIATAMGLFAAIPAVIAYNRYADKVERIETRFDTFMEEFSAIMQRHAGSGMAETAADARTQGGG